jgi:hypothetical protein
VLYELGLAVFDAILRVEAPGVDTLSIMAAVDCAGSPSQILDAGRRAGRRGAQRSHSRSSEIKVATNKMAKKADAKKSAAPKIKKGAVSYTVVPAAEEKPVVTPVVEQPGAEVVVAAPEDPLVAHPPAEAPRAALLPTNLATSKHVQCINGTEQDGYKAKTEAACVAGRNGCKSCQATSNQPDPGGVCF